MQNRRLRTKITIRVGILLILGGVILNIVVKNIIDYNGNNAIKNDMNMQQNNSTEFINQYFVVNEKKINKENLIASSTKLSGTLSENLKCTVGVYGVDGITGYKSLVEEENQNIKEHIEKAKNNKAYIFFSDKYGDYKAYFAYPLYSKGDFIGIVEIVKDYSELILNNNNIYILFTGVELVFFIMIVLFIYLIVFKATRPLENLQKGVREISKGNYGYEIITQGNNDEISELSNEYNSMRIKIKNQIGDIHNLEKSRRDFFCNITHELKTPLTSITGYGELLQGHYDNEVLRGKALESIVYESNKLNNMICSILEVSKGQILSKKVEEIEIGKLLKSLSEDMNIRRENHDVTLECNIEHGKILGVREEMKSLILNVLENAFKYSKTSTSVKVSGREIDERYKIEIVNESYGLSNNFSERAFEPFIRGENALNNKGNGLGLYICKFIAEEQGGDIAMSVDKDEVKVNISLISR